MHKSLEKLTRGKILTADDVLRYWEWSKKLSKPEDKIKG